MLNLSQAAIYQCETRGGQKIFQNSPCGKNAKSIVVQGKSTKKKRYKKRKPRPVTIKHINGIPIVLAARMFGAYTCLDKFRDEDQARAYLNKKFSHKYDNFDAALNKVLAIFSARDEVVKKYESQILSMYKTCAKQAKPKE